MPRDFLPILLALVFAVALGGVLVGLSLFLGRVRGSRTAPTTYESGDTTEQVCGETVAVRNPEQCSQEWSRFRCVYVGGTGGLAGIRGTSVNRGVETGTPCDGSGSQNDNDAGAMWSHGLAYLP